ncbi:MAG: glycosyltransferase [Victivallales bacterium]|nr:glycosyltransferase [Victivallales bacterium]
MNTTPMLSIVIPVYNTAERLENLLESVWQQTFRDFEMILVDDGSTDDSLAICQKFQQRAPERIKVVSEGHHGACRAYNRGLELACGQWLAFCDSDDYVHPELYQTLYDNAIREDAQLSCCALNDIHRNGRNVKMVFPVANGMETIRGRENILKRLFVPLLMNTDTVHAYLPLCLLKRDLLEENNIRFCEGILVCEDEVFLQEYLLRCDCVTAVDTPLYDYLRLDTSLSTGFYRKNQMDYPHVRSWFLRCREQRRLFLQSGLEASCPELRAQLDARCFFLEAQAICCNPGLSKASRREELKQLSRRAKEPEIVRTAAKGFWWMLIHLPGLLPPGLALRRWLKESCLGK